MNYSVDKLATVAECNMMLIIVGKEKSSLEYRKISLVRQKENIDTTGTEVDQDLAIVMAEVTAYTAVAATLPDGDAKDDNARKLKRAELKLLALNKKDRTYGVTSLLTTESDIARTELEIGELDVLIAAVTTRKAAI